jgi:glycosyltransferase involved in cell wall biosynthesis
LSTASAIIPVKDGERFLRELLDALAREGVDEVIVIDSGSRDRSLAIAHAAGVRVIEIAPEQFGHGHTRNLGAQESSGELICFLTQDATPCPGWLAAYREAFALDERVGAAYGPHLPRPTTSPMIARELEEFFASFSPTSEPVIQGPGDPPFLSNVNACYRRECWEQIRFRPIAYAEDQAFGVDMLKAGWLKAYHPRAAVYHAHDYPLADFMRRYFDEYRGLRESSGHIEPLALLQAARQTAAAVAADRRWMARRRMSVREQALWSVRSAAHHGGRRIFSALGSRAAALPPALERALSLEGRDSRARAAAWSTNGAGPAPLRQAPLPAPHHRPARRSEESYELMMRIMREGPAPLQEPVPGMSERERLRLALIIPPFTRGSGGHNTLFQLLTRLEARGHTCSVWLVDPHNHQRDARPARLREEVREYFAPLRGPLYKGLDAWQGADVAIATGWQTVHATLSLPRCRARAYLVNDHEPDFFQASVERVLAEDTYRHGLHCIAASPWLRDLLIDRYGAGADSFELGVDHDLYRPLDLPRRTETVVYYARHATPRRATPVGLMALAELKRRRPDLRVVLFGSNERPDTAFDYEHYPVLTLAQLARLYSEATVGLCLSMTNFSLMPKEMMACGLPCVELAGVSAESIFGADGGPLELAPLEPTLLADAIERLLRDKELRERRSKEGRAFVATHTWDRATDEVERSLRAALRANELKSSYV